MVACHGQKYVKFKLSLISNVAAHDDYDDGDEAGKNEEQMVMMMMMMMMVMAYTQNSNGGYSYS